MHEIDMEKEYIVGIDIGSSKVTMAVGCRNSDGEVSVIGVESQDVGESVSNGDIKNYVLLGKIIGEMKSALEQDLGLSINSAYVGMSGRSVYCVHYEDSVEISNPTGCVRQNEMRELQNRIDMVTSSSGDDIVERIPLRYRIDDMQEVKNPIGSYGRKLSATYLFVMISSPQVNMVRHTLFKADLKIMGLTVNPTVLPLLLLNKREAEDGVMIVDIGSDLTDISIVREDKLWYFSSLPIGASSINEDLYQFLHISKRDIDRLKRRYGSALAESVPDNTSFPVQISGRAKRQILHRNIAEIIEERLKDIIYFVDRELKGAKFINKVPCGVVLTGGSAYLQNIEELFARELKMDARLGNIFNGIDSASQEQVMYPGSVAVGLLLYGAKHAACEVTCTSGSKSVPQPPQKPEEPKVEVVTTQTTGGANQPIQPVPNDDNPEDGPIDDNPEDGQNDDNPKGGPIDDNPKDGPIDDNPKDGPIDDNPKGGQNGGKKKSTENGGPEEEGQPKVKTSWIGRLTERVKVMVDNIFEKDDVI